MSIRQKENNMSKKQLLEMEPLNDNQIAEMHDDINDAFALGDNNRARDLISDLELNKEVLSAHCI